MDEDERTEPSGDQPPAEDHPDSTESDRSPGPTPDREAATEAKADRPPESRSKSDPEDTSAVDELRGQIERSGERLQEGRQVNLPGEAALPARSLVAIAIFIVVFVLVYMLCWAVMGTIGLAVGAIVALLVGGLAVKLYADRAG